METAETVADRIRAALEHVPAERLVPAPDCGMKYLSREVAFGKLMALTAGAAHGAPGADVDLSAVIPGRERYKRIHARLRRAMGRAESAPRNDGGGFSEPLSVFVLE